MLMCIVVKYFHAHQCIHIEALPAHEQQQTVDASVKRFRAGEARQQLVAIDREAVLVVVHHADQQLWAYACLRCIVGDAVDRCLWLQHHLAVHQVLHAQMDTQSWIGGLQIAPRFDAAGTDGQMIGRITVLQQVQVSQLGVRQQRQHIVVDVLRRYSKHLEASRATNSELPSVWSAVSALTHLQIEEQAHVHDWAMRGGHIDQIQYTHLGAATADDFV